ncbi:MAG: serine protease [Bacteroidales bacterium]|nr:serine protease [Bacteroidales bacterium]
MTWTIIGVLIGVGFLFLLLEILVLPGTNIAGVIGFVLLGIGIWQAYEVYGGFAGTITLMGTILLSMFALYLALKSKTWKRAALNKNIDGKVNEIDPEKLKPGDRGKTVSRLVPMGKAVFNGEYYEVKTSGEFVDPETEIEVVKIEFNKILVKKV